MLYFLFNVYLIDACYKLNIQINRVVNHARAQRYGPNVSEIIYWRSYLSVMCKGVVLNALQIKATLFVINCSYNVVVPCLCLSTDDVTK